MIVAEIAPAHTPALQPFILALVTIAKTLRYVAVAAVTLGLDVRGTRMNAAPTILFGVLSGAPVSAHNVPTEQRRALIEGGQLDYVWSGAVHMLTGYDHLLFLFGVMFFLTGFKDIFKFVTAFSIGHSITLLGATLLGITANHYLVDAVIGFR